RVTREAADPSRANPISLARSSLPRKPPRIIRQSESPQPQNARKFSRILNESGYTVGRQHGRRRRTSPILVLRLRRPGPLEFLTLARDGHAVIATMRNPNGAGELRKIVSEEKLRSR